jgi:hypothetical protein
MIGLPKKKKKNVRKLLKILLNQSTLLTTRQLMVAVAKKNHLLKNLLRLLPTLPLTTTAAVVRLEPAAEDTIVVLHLHDLDLLDVRLLDVRLLDVRFLVDLVDVRLLVTSSTIKRASTSSTFIVVTYKLEKMPKMLLFRMATRSGSPSPFYVRNEKEGGSSHTPTGLMSVETPLVMMVLVVLALMWILGVLACTWWAPGSSSSTARQQGNDTVASTCFGVSNPSNPDVRSTPTNLLASSSSRVNITMSE